MTRSRYPDEVRRSAAVLAKSLARGRDVTRLAHYGTLVCWADENMESQELWDCEGVVTAVAREALESRRSSASS